MKLVLYPFTWIVCAFAAISFTILPAFGAPKSQSDATNAVQGWLKLDPQPFGHPLSKKIKKTETIKDSSGKALYHVVHLSPQGYVVVSADDTIEPVVAFSASGDFDSSATQGLTPVVNIDLAKRMARAHAKPATDREKKAHSKWQTFLAASPNPPPDSEINNYSTVISTIMVQPFLKTSWNQQSDAANTIDVYDYYVPPGPAGNANNDPCGCVATAMAQVMYYFQYPTTGVGTGSYYYEVNGTTNSSNLRGGDGNGGAYQWANMPLAPNGPTTVQAEEIGDLCYDAGITVGMDYGTAASGGSGADDVNVGPALVNTFSYSSSQYAIDLSGFAESNILTMINANIDARLPAMVGINGSEGGHEILADGYGYIGTTLFHHMNMGWGGADNVWYQLPIIDTQDGNGEFTVVDSCTYNIYTNGTGMIISGRITDPTGAPVVGATVTAVGGGTYTTTTDTNGIYALIKLPTSTTFSVTASLTGYTSANGSFPTGTSANGEIVGSPVYSGNYWGANLVMTRPLLTMPESGFAAIGPVGGPFNVTSQAYTLSNSTGSSISWAASSAPAWLTLSSSSGSVNANGTASLTVGLSTAANTLSTGSNVATIWITNQTTHLAQGLQFSLVIASADYPIAVAGFNDDVVVEASATGGDSLTYADAFDANNSAFNPAASFAFYEIGQTPNNLAGSPAYGSQGLPHGGGFTSAVDSKTTFQLGPYAGYNVLALSTNSPSGTLTLATPLPYKSLSVLAATSEGGGTGSLTVNFTDNSSSVAMSYNASNYFCASTPVPTAAAISQFGVLFTGDYGNFYCYQQAGHAFPALYQTSVTIPASETNKLVKSITFTMPPGQGSNTETGIFAVSGTQSGSSVSSGGTTFGFITTHSAMQYSAGSFTLEITNASAAGTVVVSASTNLTSWTPIYTNTTGASSFNYTDTAAGTTRRFYKATKN